MRGIVERRTVLRTSGGLLGLLMTAAAFAADTGEPPTLEEVVVTATKVPERLRDVAIPITAISGDRLQDLQANNFEDYAKLVPGLSLNENRPGQTVLTLQGISSFSAGSTVGIYVDDTPYGSSSGLTNAQFYSGDLNTYDMQRIEVLKGPQGTLYGASTLGGLLKFVSNAPDPSGFAAEVQAGTADTAASWGWSAKGMVNLPLSDSAAFRVSGVHEADPGYIDDPSRGLRNINSSQENGVRASFLIKLAEQLSIRLTAVGQDTDYNDINAMDLKENALSQVVLPLQPLTGERQLSQNVPQYTRSRYRIYDLGINWDMGFAGLVSTTSYATLDQAALTDISLLGTSPPVVQGTDFKLDKFTQEVRLQSAPHAHPTANQLDWLVGGYFTRESAALGQPISGTYAAVDFNLDGSGAKLASTYKEEAAFATLTYHFLPQFDVAVGGRYAHNKQTSDETFSGPYYDVLLGGVPAQVGGSSQGVGLYSIAPRWRPTDNLTVYARVASGYRPGGPNSFPAGLAGGASATFKDDTVVSGDLGIRSEFFDHSVSIDVSAFDIHWRDIQLVGLTVLSNGMETTFTQNGGTALSRGIEGQGAWVPLRGLTLSLNAAFTDAKLTEDTTPEVGGFRGNALPYVPRLTSALDAAYEFPVTADTKAFVGALVSYVGKQHTQFSPVLADQQFELGSYTTLDARLGVKRDRWSVELYCKNATDQRGVTGIGANQSANVVAIAGGQPLESTAFIIRPRTVGLNFSERF